MTPTPPDPRLVAQADLLNPSFGTRLRRYFLTGLVIAAPLATVDVPVDLPTANVEPQQRPDKPVC